MMDRLWLTFDPKVMHTKSSGYIEQIELALRSCQHLLLLDLDLLLWLLELSFFSFTPLLNFTNLCLVIIDSRVCIQRNNKYIFILFHKLLSDINLGYLSMLPLPN